MTTANDEIRTRTEAFAHAITALIRKAALEAVQAALGTAAAPAPRAAAKTSAAPPRKTTPPAKAAGPAKKTMAKAAPKPATTKKASASKRPLGGKRSPEEFAALVERLGTYIKANPGQGAEVIGKALSLPTREMALPMKKLLAAKRVRTEGQKRATRYFPA